MGTHPIFESDFDCLTDMIRSLSVFGSRKYPRYSKIIHVRYISCSTYFRNPGQPAEELADSLNLVINNFLKMDKEGQSLDKIASEFPKQDLTILLDLVKDDMHFDTEKNVYTKAAADRNLKLSDADCHKLYEHIQQINYDNSSAKKLILLDQKILFPIMIICIVYGGYCLADRIMNLFSMQDEFG